MKSWQVALRCWLLGALAGWSAMAGADGGSAANAPAAAAPPVPPGPVLAAADLQSDLALLRRAYETLHPGLYRYRSKAEMDAAFDALGREFARDRTIGEAYLGLARLTAYVQCGHTYPNFFNQSPQVVAAVLEAPRLPFEFRWLGRRMVVTRDYSGVPTLQRGAEVLSIDGRLVGEILDALLPYSRADGANEAKRVSNLEVQGRGRYEAFDVYFPLRFPRAPGRPFVLELRSEPGAAVRSVRSRAWPPMPAWWPTAPRAARPIPGNCARSSQASPTSGCRPGPSTTRSSTGRRISTGCSRSSSPTA